MNKSHFSENLYNIAKSNLNLKDIQVDYFSWGRDARHVTDDSEDIKYNNATKNFLTKQLYNLKQIVKFQINSKNLSAKKLGEKFSNFESSYNLMSDNFSKKLFCEILLSRYLGENKVKLSSFTSNFIEHYEKCSESLINSTDYLNVYKWILKKIKPKNTDIQIYTAPTILNLIETGRCYSYEKDKNKISVLPGDIVIDCGVGWGDTTTYLSSIANNNKNGRLYAFDILQESFDALDQQLTLNSGVNNITKVHHAVTDCDDKIFYTTDPGPDAKIVDYETPYKVVSITLDTFIKKNNIPTVNFIKMDIEGAERDALKGAENIIRKYKPRLAISVYHLDDDFEVIPRLINSIRDDYEFYIDCTTGFGGETILFCK